MTGTASTDRVNRFDIYDPDMSRDLDELLDEARSGGCPVAHSAAHGGYYLLTRYADVTAVLSNDAVFSSGGGKSIPSRQSIEMPPLDSDPPEHREYRRLLNRFFTKASLAKHEEAIRGIARSLVDGFVGDHRVEILNGFSAPLTGATLCRVILDLDDDELMAEAQTRVAKIGSANSPDAWAELTAFLQKLVQGRTTTGRDDVFNAVLTGTVDGRRLTELEKLGVIIVLFLGGLDTTRAAITCIVRHLALNPGLEARLRDTDWTRSDLDEFLRHDSVVTGLARTVTTETELGGRALAAGDRVLVHYYAANHDPAQFTEPATLDFERRRNPHVAFGLGIHRCLGSNLARLQIKVAFEELLGRVQNIRLAEGAEIEFAAGVARQPIALPIIFDEL